MALPSHLGSPAPRTFMRSKFLDNLVLRSDAMLAPAGDRICATKPTAHAHCYAHSGGGGGVLRSVRLPAPCPRPRFSRQNTPGLAASAAGESFPVEETPAKGAAARAGRSLSTREGDPKRPQPAEARALVPRGLRPAPPPSQPAERRVSRWRARAAPPRTPGPAVLRRRDCPGETLEAVAEPPGRPRFFHLFLTRMAGSPCPASLYV